MRRTWLRRAALSGLVLGLACAATRPHYGGVLRVELRESVESADPPQTGRLAQLAPGFAITRWEAGHRAVYAADENAPGGRPFLDGIDIEMGRSLREESIDLELGKADVVEAGPGEPRGRPFGSAAARRVWTSAPVRVLALVFGPRVTDPRIRQALALAVDRAAIHGVLLQRQGEISGALLPQWLSGYAFLFPAAADLPQARALAGEAPAAARSLTLSVQTSEPMARSIADRIALNARDAGLTISVVQPNSPADVRLAEGRIASNDPTRALEGIAAAFGLPQPAAAPTPEALYAAERALLEGFRVIPLFHLPDFYAAAPRVHGGPGITPLGEWRFQDLWLDEAKP